MDFTKLLLTVPAITATVEFLKTLGVQGRFSQLAAVITGIIFSMLTLLATYTQNLELINAGLVVNALAQGLLYGLCAAGFYDLAAGKLKAPNDYSQRGRHAYES